MAKNHTSFHESDLRVAFVTEQGAAHIELYLRALRDCREVIVATCDASQASSEFVQMYLGRRSQAHYVNLDELISAERPAVALITAEAVNSPTLARTCLKSGVHVIMEKPGCVREREFKELASLATKRRLHLMLALKNRLLPAVIKARKMIRNGQLGTVFAVEGLFLADRSRLRAPEYQRSWFADPARSGGGHMIWLGIHKLDLIQFITGQDILDVSGFRGTVGEVDLPVEDLATASFRLQGGGLGVLTSGYLLSEGYESRLTIWGSAGRLSLAITEPDLEWEQFGVGRRILHFDKTGNPYLPFIAAALESCRNDSPPPITPGESLRAIRCVFAFYKAADRKRAISIAAPERQRNKRPSG